MRFLRMSFYFMASIMMMSSAYEKGGVAAILLWGSGLLASINAGMYFWEWSEPENFHGYIEKNTNWRFWTVLAFWAVTFAGAVFALSQ